MSEELEREVLDDTPRDFSQMLNKVLENPEIIRAVAQALASGESGSPSAPEKAEPKVAAPAALFEKLPQIADTLKLSGGGRSGGKHTSLLVSLKPYVSKKRCDAIDNMVKYSRIAELIKNIK